MFPTWRSSRVPRIDLLAAAGVWLLAASAAAPPAVAQKLTLDRLATTPYLSGTPPMTPSWSPDGKRLAFLWNDQGLPFRDIWLVDASGSNLRRLTDMAKVVPDVEDPGLTDDAARAWQIAARARTGIARIPPCCLAFPPTRYAPVWAPDGQSLVFPYRGAIWSVNADGSGAPTRLTESAGDKYAIALSADGTYLSYLQDGDLWLLNRKTRERVQATRRAVPPLGIIQDGDFTRPQAEFSNYAWSPNGDYIALHFDDRRAVRTLLFPNYLGEETTAVPVRRDYTGDNTATRTLVVLAVKKGDLDDIDLPNLRVTNGYVWSGDGRLLIDQMSMDARDRWLFLYGAGDKSLKEIWHDARPSRNSQAPASDWQSDGKGVVFVSDKDGHHHIYALALDGSAPRQLTQGEWSVVGESGSASFRVSRATKQIFFVSNQKNPYERQYYRMAENGGPITPVTTLPGTHLPSLAPDGARVATIRSDDLTPQELYIVAADGKGTEAKVTASPVKEFASYKWVQPRYVTFKSHLDGTTLHGRLIEPPTLDRSKRYPVILGPVYPNSVRNRWGEREEWRGVYASLQQFLVLERNYIVFQVDTRGSVGYGRAFSDGLINYGGVDIDDLESGVRYLKTFAYVDADRIGLWGSSYGGLMTAMSLFKKPGLYRAGVASAPATNVWHALDGQERVLGKPHSSPELYRQSSVASFGDDLKDHLMIIHGMQDDIVLFKDSVTLAEKLMMLGKSFDFVVLPSSVHAWTRKDYVARFGLEKLVELLRPLHGRRAESGGKIGAVMRRPLASGPTLE